MATYWVPYAQKQLIALPEGKMVTQHYSNFLYYMELMELRLTNDIVVPYRVLQRTLFLFHMLEGLHQRLIGH